MLQNIQKLNMSASSAFTITLEDPIVEYVIHGTATAPVSLSKDVGSTEIEGMILRFRFIGDLSSNALNIFGTVILI